MRETHCGSVPGVPFQIIVGGHWLIQAAIECTWPHVQVFLGSSVRPVLHAIHISVHITHTQGMWAVFHWSIHFPLLTQSYHPPCLRSQTVHHIENITVRVYYALACCWWQIEISCCILHFTSIPLFQVHNVVNPAIRLALIAVRVDAVNACKVFHYVIQPDNMTDNTRATLFYAWKLPQLADE